MWVILIFAAVGVGDRWILLLLLKLKLLILLYVLEAALLVDRGAQFRQGGVALLLPRFERLALLDQLGALEDELRVLKVNLECTGIASMRESRERKRVRTWCWRVVCCLFESV